MALWLDHALSGAVRGYLNALRSGQVSDLRDLPASSGWGELSALGDEAQRYLGHHQQMARAFEELSRLQKQLEEARLSLRGWLETERWDPLPTHPGPLGAVARLLNEGESRSILLHEQNREAARQIRDDLQRSLDDARISAEQTERGFVEATSLLTTVRELQRLSSDLERTRLSGSVAPPDPATIPDAPAYLDALRAAAARALGELVQASGESIAHLSTGLMRVREVGDHVQALGNRATLMALNVMVARGKPGEATEEDIAELKQLAAEVRSATDRVAQLSLAVEADVERASQRMKGVRERVAETLDRIPAPVLESAPVQTAPAASPADLAHVLERMREMIQDATAKGERLSSAGERSSRAAERLVRHLEESASEMEALEIRLNPGAEASALAEEPVVGEDLRPAEDSEEPEGSDRNLRLLGPEDVRPGDRRFTDREDRP